MLPYGRKNPLPFPFSQRSHVGNLRQTIQGKGVIHKRVETAGVYPLVRPRGVSARSRRGARRIPALRRAQLPAEVQRKNSPPVRGEHANAVRVPRSAGAEKDCRPERMNPPARFKCPRGSVQKPKSSTLFRVLLRITNAYAFLINASRRSRPLSISVSEVA